MNKLTQQQKKFIQEYIKTVDGELAARLAGYKTKDLKTQAEKLLSDCKIVKNIKLSLKKQIDSLCVPKGYVIQNLLKIAEFSLEEEDITDKEGNYTGKKKFRDTSAALKALESLCKYLGFGTAQNGENKHAVKIITISNLDDSKI